MLRAARSRRATVGNAGGEASRLAASPPGRRSGLLQVLDLLFPPIEYRRFPLLQFECNAARQACIGHPLRSARIDRTYEVGEPAVVTWRRPQRLELQLHLIERVLAHKGQRGTAAAREH